MSKTTNSLVEVQMLIRAPVSKVFEAFADPAITTNFWFTRSTGKLTENSSVTWYWDMYEVSAKVHVKKIIPFKKISIEWGEPLTSVDFEMIAVNENATYVQIKHYGFKLVGDELVHALKDSTGGFTMLLAGLKAYLEHGIRLNLVGDKHPKEVAGLGL